MALLLACSVLLPFLPAAAVDPTVRGAVLGVAAPAITPAPRYALPQYRALKYRGLYNRRADDGETCGYFYASADEPFTCAVGDACVSNTIDNVFGCCSTDTNGDPITLSCLDLVNAFTSCIEYKDSDSCTGDCVSYNRICGSTEPYCGVAHSLTDGTTYSNWFCQSEADATPLLLYATPTDTPTGDDDTMTSSSLTSSRATTLQSSTTSSDVSNGSVTEPVQMPEQQAEKDNGTDKGAIAGGVIAGLIGLALIVGGAIFFLRRAKTKERKAAIAEVSQI